MKNLKIDITDELDTILRMIVGRLAAKELQGLHTIAGMVDSPKMTRVVESLLRNHPAVDLIREELGLEWQSRNPIGTPRIYEPWKKIAVKKVVVKTVKKRKGTT